MLDSTRPDCLWLHKHMDSRIVKCITKEQTNPNKAEDTTARNFSFTILLSFIILHFNRETNENVTQSTFKHKKHSVIASDIRKNDPFGNKQNATVKNERREDMEKRTASHQWIT